MMLLVTGGSKSGKSSWAERQAIRLSANRPRCYLATMQVRDEEDGLIVARHERQREGKGFRVHECPRGFQALEVDSESLILLEDVPNLLANHMFDGSCPGAALQDMANLRDRCALLIAVTNEVGSDGIAYPEETMAYIEALGKLNAKLADMADCVVEVVCGYPMVLKGALP